MAWRAQSAQSDRDGSAFAARRSLRGRLFGGGTSGNERLTAATGALLLVLLAALGVTIVRIGGLLNEHMFLGMLLLGPVAAQAVEHRLPLRPLLHGQPALPGQGAAAGDHAGDRADRRDLDGRRLRERCRAAVRRPELARHAAPAAQGQFLRLACLHSPARPRPPRRAPRRRCAAPVPPNARGTTWAPDAGDERCRWPPRWSAGWCSRSSSNHASVSGTTFTVTCTKGRQNSTSFF